MTLHAESFVILDNPFPLMGDTDIVGRNIVKFTVILEPEEDGSYLIHCPVLPGCSSQGNSVEESLENIKEAIIGVLRLRHDEKLPIPKETPEMVAEEIRQILADRAEDGLPFTIETREVELPTEVVM